jgi:hypothetical protein
MTPANLPARRKRSHETARHTLVVHHDVSASGAPETLGAQLPRTAGNLA